MLTPSSIVHVHTDQQRARMARCPKGLDGTAAAAAEATEAKAKAEAAEAAATEAEATEAEATEADQRNSCIVAPA